MSQNEDHQTDPSASTQMFRRFVADNNEPETAPRPSVTPYILAAVAALAVIVLGIVIVTALL